MENKTIPGEPKEDSFRIQDLWAMFLPRWHWFVLSIILCSALAVLYLMKSPNIYTRTATVLIKEDGKNGGYSNGMLGDMQNFGFIKNTSDINNELITLTSPTLMTEVVKRLNLNEHYSITQGLKDIDLYKQSPITIITHAQNEAPCMFDVEILSEASVKLSGFVNEEGEIAGSINGQIGQQIKTPVGSITIVPHKEVLKDFVGETIHFSKMPVDPVTDMYTARLNAALENKDASVVNLSISDASIKKAEDILNTLIEVYNENWIKDKNQITVSTSQFITDRLTVIESELGHVDENISNYKSSNLLPDVSAATGMYLSENVANEKELITLNNQLAVAGFIRQELNPKNLEQTLPSNAGIANVNVEQLISQYNTLVLDRNRLIANSSEDTPIVKEKTDALQALQKTILHSIDNLIVSLRTEIESQRKREAKTAGRLASSPGQQKYLLSVERQQKVKEQLYIYLLQKREENQLSQAFTAYNTRVITAPRGSNIPTSPRRSQILLIAIVIGIVVPGVIIFMLENFNTKIRGRRDLDDMNTPFLGELPLVSKKKKDLEAAADRIVVHADSNNTINEAFRVVRTNLEFMMPKGEGGKVIMVTSLNPGSGKTFITMNLATSFVVKDKRAIVIDLDLRRGTSSKYVNSPKQGLSYILAGQIDDWRSLIIKNNNGTMPDVLPVGTLPPNPSELLFSPIFKELLAELREEYDLVFFDCPPVEIVADTTIVSKYADMTLLVVRAGLFEREMLPVIDAYYEEHKFHNLAMLLNGTTSAYGGYGHSNRYGYGYGYGSYSEQKKRSRLSRYLKL